MKRPKLAIILVVLFAYFGASGASFLFTEIGTCTEVSTESEKELKAETILEKAHSQKVRVSRDLQQPSKKTQLVSRYERQLTVNQCVNVFSLHILFCSLLI